MVIFVFGLPGSGKSFFAKKLAENLQAKYVNSDQLRMQLIPERKYTDAEKMIVYDSMLTEMTKAIKGKSNIVLDATFYKQAIRDTFIKKALELKVQFVFIEVIATENIIAERLSKPRKFSEANFDVYLQVKDAWEPLSMEHLILNSTNQNISTMINNATAFINSIK